MSLSDKLASGFDIAIQWTKQQIGKAQASADDPKLIENYKRFVSTQEHLEQVLKEANTWAKQQADQLKTFEQLQDRFADLGAEPSSIHVAGKQVESFILSGNVLYQGQVKLHESFVALMLEPLESLQTREVYQAVELKSKYDVAHLAYDSAVEVHQEAVSKNQTADKITQASQELKVKEAHYTRLRSELINKIEEIEQKKNLILTKNLRSYMQAQVAFYGNGYRAFPDDLDDENKEGPDASGAVAAAAVAAVHLSSSSSQQQQQQSRVVDDEDNSTLEGPNETS